MSKLFEALAKAERQRKANAQARELQRATVPSDGDTLAAAARWIEKGPALVHAFSSLLTERDRLRARAEAAERECQGLREQASGRPWLGALAPTSMAVVLAASIGIAAISGAWLSGGRLWRGGERSVATRPTEGESTARAELTARTRAEPDGGRGSAVVKGTDAREEVASTDQPTPGNVPRALGDEPSAKRAKQSPARRLIPPPSSPAGFMEGTRAMTATGPAATEPHDAGAIVDWLLKEGSRAGP
jgi:hypothetical protein